MHLTSHVPRSRLALALGLTVALSGCDLVLGLFRPTQEEALVEALVAGWLTPGQAFAQGRFGGDTISLVEAAEDGRSWRVMIPEEGALGGARVWDLSLSEVEVLPVQSGSDFASFINDRVVEVDRSKALPRNAWQLLADGRIQAVGVVTGEVNRIDRPGRAGVEIIAFLEPAGEEGALWTFQEGSRSTLILRDALRLVYRDMVLRDERVQTCMGSADPRSVERSVQLECVGEVLAEQFGGEM